MSVKTNIDILKYIRSRTNSAILQILSCELIDKFSETIYIYNYGSLISNDTESSLTDTNIINLLNYSSIIITELIRIRQKIRDAHVQDSCMQYLQNLKYVIDLLSKRFSNG